MRHQLSLAFAAGLATAAAAFAQTPAGGELRINTVTVADQAASVSAMDPAGGLVVVWRSRDYGSRMAAQRFDAAGAPRGGEFQANSQLSSFYQTGAVATAADGSFVVAWQDYGPVQGGEQFIHARRFGAGGAPVGQEFVAPSNHAGRPSVTSGPGGDFLLVWHDVLVQPPRDVRGQRVDARGVPLGAEFRINTSTTGYHIFPSATADAQGNFVVVWMGFDDAGDAARIYGRRLDSSGTGLGAEFRVDAATTVDAFFPQAAAAADGRFVVAWTENGQPYRLKGRRFAASGAPLGAEFLVNAYTTVPQGSLHVASDAAGNFVASWSRSDPGFDDFDVFAQRFSADGAPRGGEFQANTTTTGYQFSDSVASDPQGNVVVTWTSDGQDGSGRGVYGQRFGGLRPAALAVDPAGNGVFEPGETVDVRPSWRNVNGAAQAFGGTAPSLTGPAPATYQIVDDNGDYGGVGNGVTAPCLDCYRVAVPTTARPTLHWDAVLEEKITPDTLGQDQLWRLHLGRSFTDVPSSSAFYPFIETLLHRSVTSGCGGANYCPAASTARDQLAVFVLAAKEGPFYRPPACGTPAFTDVPASSPFCPYVEELARRGVTGGCGGGKYCPGAPVPREQMPVFVLRTLDPALDPPACGTPRFADVPAASPYCRWIEELARRGVVSGCGGSFYCPGDPVTREQMAVFIVGTFGLNLYGP